MATTYGVDRERAARAPAVPPDVNSQRQQVVLLLGTFTASFSYSAALGPWLYDPHGYTGGGQFTHPRRYLVFFYCNAIAFVASLAIILLHLLPVNLISRNQRIKWYALRVAMTLSLLALYARTYLPVKTSIFIFCACVIALILYIATQILVLSSKLVEIALSCVGETSQKCPKLLRSKKKKYLLKMEQKNHHHQNIVTGQGSGDAHQILKRSQMHLLLLGALTASVTYQAGLNGDFCQKYFKDDRMLDKRYLVFFFGNASTFVVSLAILPILILSKVFSTQEIKYYSALQVCVTLELLGLIGSYVARRSWQLSNSGFMSMLVGWVSLYVVIHVVVFLLQVFLACAPWRQALREKMKHCPPAWLKKLFGLSIDEPVEDDDDEDEDEDEQEDEEAVIMDGKLEMIRKILLLLAILAALLMYHANASTRPDNLVNHRRLAFQYCNATIFITSLSIIAMLANMKFPEARCVRWHTLRLCVILEVIGLMGAFAATSSYRKASKIDVLVLVLAVLLCIAFHFTMFISGTARALVQRSSQLFVGADPFPQEDDGSEDELEFGIAGGTNEEPLGLEISSPILGGALTLMVAVPVMAILASPVKLLVAIMIASIGVSLWRRSFARLLRALARALQRRSTANLQGSTASPPTGSSSRASSTRREQLVSAICQGLCKVIDTLCAGTWMWILILVIRVPSLRPNLKVKCKMSKILAVLGVLVVSAPTMVTAATDTATATGTSTTTRMDAPSRATSSTMTRTPTTAATNASSTSMGDSRDGPPVVPRPRRNRRPNSRLIGQDWVN